MLGLRLIRYHIIRRRFCALTPPSTSSFLFTSKVHSGVKGRKTPTRERANRKAFDQEGPYVKIRSGMDRYTKLNNEDCANMNLHQIVEWVELSATPPRYAHYKRILEIIRFGAFHPSEYTDHELAILMSISASKSINISANERRAFASELFELVSTTHGIDVWNAKIKADIDNGEKIDVMQMLEELSKRELEPTLKTYELVTEIYANEGKFYEITEIIEHIKSENKSISSEILKNLVYASVIVGGRQAGEKTIKEILDRKDLKMSSKDQTELYLFLARGISKSGSLDDVKSILEAKKSSFPTDPMKNKAVNEQLLEICFNLIDRGVSKSIKEIIPFMTKFNGLLYFLSSYKVIVNKANEYTAKKDYETSIQLLSLVDPLNLQEFFAFIHVKYLKNELTKDDIFHLIDKVKENHTSLRYPLTYCIDIFHSIKGKEGKSLSQKKHAQSRNLLNSLIKKFFESEEFERIGKRRNLLEIQKFFNEGAKTTSLIQDELLASSSEYSKMEEIAESSSNVYRPNLDQQKWDPKMWQSTEMESKPPVERIVFVDRVAELTAKKKQKIAQKAIPDVFSQRKLSKESVNRSENAKKEEKVEKVKGEENLEPPVDSQELDKLIQEARNLQELYTKNPKDINPMNIAELYAYILEEKLKERPLRPVHLLTTLKSVFRLNLTENQLKNVKIGFRKMFDVCITEFIARNGFKQAQELIKLGSKHDVSISPKTMLLYAQELNKRVMNKQEERVLGQSQAYQTAKNLANPQLNQIISSETDDSLDKLAEIHQSNDLPHKPVPKPARESSKIDIAPRKPIKELPRKVLVDKLAENGPEKSTISDVIETLDQEGRKKTNMIELPKKEIRMTSSWPPSRADYERRMKIKKDREEIRDLLEQSDLSPAFDKVISYVAETNDLSPFLSLISAAVKQDNSELLKKTQDSYQRFPLLAFRSPFPIHLATVLLEQGKTADANRILSNEDLVFGQVAMSMIIERERDLNRPDVLHKLFMRFYKANGTKVVRLMHILPLIIRQYGINEDLEGLTTLNSDLERLSCPINKEVELLINMNMERLQRKPEQLNESKEVKTSEVAKEIEPISPSKRVKTSSKSPLKEAKITAVGAQQISSEISSTSQSQLNPKSSSPIQPSINEPSPSKLQEITHETIFPRAKEDPLEIKQEKRTIKLTYPILELRPNPAMFPNNIRNMIQSGAIDLDDSDIDTPRLMTRWEKHEK